MHSENEHVVSSLFQLPSALHELSFARSFIRYVCEFLPVKFSYCRKKYVYYALTKLTIFMLYIPNNKLQTIRCRDDKFDAHEIFFFHSNGNFQFCWSNNNAEQSTYHKHIQNTHQQFKMENNTRNTYHTMNLKRAATNLHFR